MASNYWLSSQCNHWLFTRAQLATARAEDERYAEHPDEVEAIGVWACNMIATLTKRLSLRQRVTATASIYFRRFYARSANAYAATDPALVATACVYVAAKVEETPVHVRSVIAEAHKIWTELGHPDFPNDVAALAEMEFYLFEELDFHLIVHHPYRALLAISGTVGKAALLRADKAAGVGLGLGIPGLNETSFGSGNGGGVDLEMASATAAAAGLDEEQAKAWEADRAALTRGDDGQPLARLEELEEAALQFAWFVLNDTYRTDISLLYPPHLIAIAALYLGLLLHPTSRQRMNKSVQLMTSRREKWRHACEEHAVRSAAAGQAHAAAASGSRRSGNGMPAGAGSAQSPQYAYTPTASHASPAAGGSSLRGLASLPMRPAHLPVRPGGVAATSTPSTPFPQQHGAGTTPRSAGGAAYSLDSPGASSAVSTPPDSGAMPSSAPAPVELPRVAPLPPPPAPPPDALTFLAALNVDIRQIAEIVQDILGMYELWHRLDAPPAETPGESKTSSASAASGVAFGAPPSGGMISDGSGMLQRIERMRERRRTELLLLAAAGGGAIPKLRTR